MFWCYVLPLGFLLTQYTITGFDASAHISEETHGAAESRAKGVWRSIFYSAIIGYIVLLAITFARARRRSGQRAAAASCLAVFETRDEHGLGEGRADHLVGRPAVLRHGLPDQRVAHDVRVQP